jgi:hypothetical protein
VNGVYAQWLTLGQAQELLELPVGGQVTIEFVRPGTGVSGIIVLTRR